MKNRNHMISRAMVILFLIPVMTLSVKSAFASVASPDLIFQPEKTVIEVTANDMEFNVKIVVFVKNAGKADITDPFRLGFYLTKSNSVTTEDLFLNYGEFKNLQKGYYNSMTVTVNLAASQYKLYENGTYRIGVIVDDKNQVTESDETNNSYVIDKEISYVVPSGVIKRQEEEKKKEIADAQFKEIAGKILFAAGSINKNDMAGNKFGTEFTFKQFTEANGYQGADFSFLVNLKPMKELFGKYVKSGMDAAIWNPNVYYVNLFFRIFVDGKEAAVSEYEFENVRIDETKYYYWLLGEYAHSQTLLLQQILQTELYKLSAGKHTVKIEVYPKSTKTNTNNVGADIVSEGEFTIDVKPEEKVEYYKKWAKELYPPSEMKNPTLEANVKQIAVDFLANLDNKITTSSIKYFAFCNSEWSYEKNNLGVVLYRYIRVTMYVKTSDGSCYQVSFNVEEECIGNNTYAKVKMSPGYTYRKCLSPMPCEVIK